MHTTSAESGRSFSVNSQSAAVAAAPNIAAKIVKKQRGFIIVIGATPRPDMNGWNYHYPIMHSGLHSVIFVTHFQCLTHPFCEVLFTPCMAFQSLAALPLIIKIPFVCRLCLFCNGLPSNIGLRVLLCCLFDLGPYALLGIPLALMILHICP